LSHRSPAIAAPNAKAVPTCESTPTIASNIVLYPALLALFALPPIVCTAKVKSWCRISYTRNGEAVLETDAQRRRRKQQDATRERVALWLTPAEARMIDRYKKAWGLPSRIATLRRMFIVSRKALPRRSVRKGE
jgi:hypothetical protein